MIYEEDIVRLQDKIPMRVIYMAREAENLRQRERKERRKKYRNLAEVLGVFVFWMGCWYVIIYGVLKAIGAL